MTTISAHNAYIFGGSSDCLTELKGPGDKRINSGSVLCNQEERIKITREADR